MPAVKAFAALNATEPLSAFQFNRREPGPRDVVIDIAYCGVCHTDLHQVRNEWGGAQFPMVPGHEIVGRIAKVGSEVTSFKAGRPGGGGLPGGFLPHLLELRAGSGAVLREGRRLHLQRHGDGPEDPHLRRVFRSVLVDEAFALHVRPSWTWPPRRPCSARASPPIPAAPLEGEEGRPGRASSAWAAWATWP